MISDVETRASVDALAAKLVEVLAVPYQIQNRFVRSSASMGIEIYGPDAPDVETLLLNADVALYRAKAEDPGSYRFFTRDVGDGGRATETTPGASTQSSAVVSDGRNTPIGRRDQGALKEGVDQLPRPVISADRI